MSIYSLAIWRWPIGRWNCFTCVISVTRVSAPFDDNGFQHNAQKTMLYTRCNALCTGHRSKRPDLRVMKSYTLMHRIMKSYTFINIREAANADGGYAHNFVVPILLILSGHHCTTYEAVGCAAASAVADMHAHNCCKQMSQSEAQPPLRHLRGRRLRGRKRSG